MLNVKLYSQSRTSTIKLFSLRLNHILKMYILNSIKLPLGSIFFQITPFREKAYNCENFERKGLLLTIEQFFFQNLKLCNGMASSIEKVF